MMRVNDSEDRNCSPSHPCNSTQTDWLCAYQVNHTVCY